MAIASDVPFVFMIKRNFSAFSKDTDGKFYTTEAEAWKSEENSYKVEENEEIEVEFNSTDKSAKLYLEALDIIPIHKVGINSDIDGQLYHTPSETPFYLYMLLTSQADAILLALPVMDLTSILSSV